VNKGENMGSGKRIVVRPAGPYLVYGRVPLVRKIQIVSEYGEPLAWKKGKSFKVGETYTLCRCGHSRRKPFCDGTHRTAGFDGTETADTSVTAARQRLCRGGTHIVVKFDDSLCMDAGFCANRVTTIESLVPATADTTVRSQVIAMIERCPSGALTYALARGEPDIEPDYPQQVAVVTEITSAGPIDGPLWVTGCVQIERADGQPLRPAIVSHCAAAGARRANPCVTEHIDRRTSMSFGASRLGLGCVGRRDSNALNSARRNCDALGH
jgi:CDGSH-type Zn-finger protein